MDSYVIRIYRRDPGRGRAVAGIVEDVEARRTRAFSGRDDLWRILTARTTQPSKRRARSHEAREERAGP